MSGINPVPQRRRLGAELRALREERRLTLDAVAEHMECSTAKMSRIENGRVPLRLQDLLHLLDLYQITGAERERLVADVREARRKGWWRPYSNVMPDGFDIYIGLEGEATTINSYQTAFVEGLLQTEQYAAALLGLHRDLPDETVQRRIELRMARQRILERDDPPHITVILDESVLLRPIGGTTVMIEQCRRLTAEAAKPNVTIEVVPLAAAEVNPPAGVPFVVLGFADLSAPQVVYAEQLVRNEILEKAEDVGRYTATWNYMRATALSPQDSVTFINRTADRFASRRPL